LAFIVLILIWLIISLFEADGKGYREQQQARSKMIHTRNDCRPNLIPTISSTYIKKILWLEAFLCKMLHVMLNEKTYYKNRIH